MHVATALRIVSVVAAKAVLIGVVYWRRAEILGANDWPCFIAVVAVCVAVAIALYVAARHHIGGLTD
jgi:hypothetical protein